MKGKLFFPLVLILAFAGLEAQVGIGTQAPRGALDINQPVTNTMGLVLPTNDDAGNIVNPQGGNIAVGTLIYDSTLDCVRVYRSTGWSSCIETVVPVVPATLTLAQNRIYLLLSVFDQDYLPFSAPADPAMPTVPVAADGANEAVAVDVQGSITTTGVTVLIPVTATDSGTLLAYSDTITVPADLTEDGIGRELTLSWEEQSYTSATTFITASIVAETGTFNAKKLDVNAGNGNDYLGVLLGTFTYPYNKEGNTTTYQVRDIAGIPDKAFNDGAHNFIYTTVTSATGRIWLSNNLGANYAKVGHASFNPLQQAAGATDADAYGSLYQWGRLSDGHEFRTSASITTLSGSDVPGHGSFIRGSDWRSPANDNLWQGESGVNNPCPGGFRLPTEAEWNTERTSWSSNNAAGALASPLKLSLAGSRSGNNATFGNVGTSMFLWSSTINGTSSRNLTATSTNSQTGTNIRSAGFSVRCIKE